MELVKDRQEIDNSTDEDLKHYGRTVVGRASDFLGKEFVTLCGLIKTCRGSWPTCEPEPEDGRKKCEECVMKWNSINGRNI